MGLNAVIRNVLNKWKLEEYIVPGIVEKATQIPGRMMPVFSGKSISNIYVPGHYDVTVSIQTLDGKKVVATIRTGSYYYKSEKVTVVYSIGRISKEPRVIGIK